MTAFCCNVIFKICTSISKVTIYVPNIFNFFAPPGSVNKGEKYSLHNFAAFQSGGASQRNPYLKLTFDTNGANFENYIASEKWL